MTRPSAEPSILRTFLTSQFISLYVQGLAIISSVSIHRGLSVGDRGTYAAVLSITSLLGGAFSLGIDIRLSKLPLVSDAERGAIIVLHSASSAVFGLLIMRLASIPGSFVFDISGLLTLVLIIFSSALNSTFLSFLVIVGRVQLYNILRALYSTVYSVGLGSALLLHLVSLKIFLFGYLAASTCVALYLFRGRVLGILSTNIFHVLALYKTVLLPIRLITLIGLAQTVMYGLITLLPAVICTKEITGALAAVGSLVGLSQGVASNLSKSFVSRYRGSTGIDARGRVLLTILGLGYAAFYMLFALFGSIVVNILYGARYAFIGYDIIPVSILGFGLSMATTFEDINRTFNSDRVLVGLKLPAILCAVLGVAIFRSSFEGIVAVLAVAYVGYACAMFTATLTMKPAITSPESVAAKT